MVARDIDASFVVIGGGFYGCCLALFLRSISEDVVLIESETELLTRSSRVNQARVHSGYHYPRSFVTAAKSAFLQRRFVTDFPNAIIDDFDMLYAVSRRRSKVSGQRFLRMFQDMGAPIREARRERAALFEPDMVEAVFECREFAFDYRQLRDLLSSRLRQFNVDVRLGQTVTEIRQDPARDVAEAQLSDGSTIRAKWVFNITYAQINGLLKQSGLPLAPLKHEFAEIALVKPPEAFDGLAVTVMDGPFFSLMPYPAENLYSLTHVRYTPHTSWTDETTEESAYQVGARLPQDSRYLHMVLDAARYMPSIAEAQWQRSIFDVKSVLIKNEHDDGRPILFHRSHPDSRVISVLGGKLDNIYDLYDCLKRMGGIWRNAHDRYVWKAA
ncbi:FAD-binding oxidoreductase [Ruegeria sp. 2012CJ41-6]|uniref:FAD-binding oxidoreductase n=1 Tax=Ruegeria spongiae TaxID=2942209 RepID=A0ABT0Q8R8_9RHOB|nr:FAD-binding oxidoreductase [Ruegeria spongiae]MCL6285274.1 FAD-binding oxidoreductase [Ruegeria spongiae]